MLTPTAKIWHNGRFIRWEDATIHVLSHVVSYGTSVFEGIRCYATSSGPAVFRLHEHVRRMVDSAKIYRMEELGFTREQLAQAMLEVVRVNEMKSCYIRPIAIRGYGEIGVNPLKNPIDVYIACWEWGKYLGEEALAEGVDVCVSSWNRIAPNTLPALAKAGANYMNSQLIKMEAITNGYSEGIALDAAGYVSEGSGENIFVVRDGKIHTPPLGASVLPGITRDSVLQLASDLKIPTVETIVPREMLYIADEVFFSGTAAEITPIRSIDRIKIGKGHRGPIAERLQKEFFAIINGSKEDRHGWLSPVYAHGEKRQPVEVAG
jgi:branched-chain amino acid aminotransferase